MAGNGRKARHSWGVVVAGVLVMLFGVAGGSLPASGQGNTPPAVQTK